ncbi:iron-siderophore ABC transporter substrate-binding protein [Pseudonocardia humida]|uniref:Iron-siderophore ABC transporter substrate-binding protein n=1 Tax=Pseudonocardia humida TaxID=2800819 RepID=A0ABT1A4D4_9PSEU|nr:iron-siderophore ABC transporter substrate-binding protein [Pseudonocardia humida]MCO1657872.1 iron-siderophore ABC transporter substrate-binding protein [Pseudonocardia humida]
MIAHRRRFGWLTACVSASVLLLTACGGGGGTAEPAAPGAGGEAGGAFPVSIEHDYGTTEIPSRPQRVVSLGYTDQDPILALDVVPVAIREWSGNKPSATWEWAQDKLQGQQPQVLNGATIDPETVAALAPDLIVAITAGLTQEEYDTFSRIAPTIIQPKGGIPYATAWQDATRLVGQALGKSEQAEQQVTDLEARFEEAKAAHPQLAGKKTMVAGVSTGGANWFAYSSQDSRGRFFTSLGMTVPPEIDQLAGTSFYTEISLEQLDLLDQNDVVAWMDVTNGAPESRIENVPGHDRLTVFQQDRIVQLTDVEANAMGFSSVLSLPALLDSVPPKMAAALGG